jgi:undecaprenyl pyrophosphate phosphatase UppP
MQSQQHREQKQSRPRWRMSVGEWVLLLLNTLWAGATGWSAWFAAFYEDYPRTPKQLQMDYLLGGTFFLVALGAGLTSLLLLLRQTRLAAWFQWLVALGCVLFAGVYFWFERQRSSLQGNLLVVGVTLVIAALFVFSGRFLRTVSDSND